MYIPFLNVDYVLLAILFTDIPTINAAIIEKNAIKGDCINGENIKTNIPIIENIVNVVILKYAAIPTIAINDIPKNISGFPLNTFIIQVWNSKGAIKSAILSSCEVVHSR